MSVLEPIARALDATGLPWREDGWEPEQPPQEGAYIVVSDSQEIDFDDAHELFAVTHRYGISLYDYGDRAIREHVRNCLMAACTGITGMRCTGYSKETKLYETAYSVSEQIEKVRVV